MASSLDIKFEMAAFDKKDRAYYDNFAAEDVKKFSTYLILRWGASVAGSSDLQAYYLRAMNERVNKNFFDISTTTHNKLQWLSCTTVSPGMGQQHHYWLGAKKKETGGISPKIIKFLEGLYPTMKDDEILLFAKLNDKAAFKELAMKQGMTDKDIKELLK